MKSCLTWALSLRNRRIYGAEDIQPTEDGFVQKKIEWNYEELKTEVAAAADEYAVSVYTDETIKQAKADRAKLNKFVDALRESGLKSARSFWSLTGRSAGSAGCHKHRSESD